VKRPELDTVPLCLREKASPFWIILLLVEGDPELRDFWRIQAEFMQAQWKAFTEQTKELSEAATKSATNVMKGSSE
jgi:hypothetical protein